MWTTRNGNYQLALGSTRMTLAPQTGGRITEFSLDDKNVLTELVDLGSWTNGGSTFWTSPQSAWGWPPDPQLDRGEYQVELSADRLLLTSAPFLLAGTRLTVSKSFAPTSERDGVDIEYRVHNHGQTVELAGWEISRVPAHGVSFFPGSQPVSLGDKPCPVHSRDASGVVWMPHRDQPVEAKLGADGGEGYIAYADDSLLFLKTFHDVAADQAAPEEAEIELYVQPGRYVEIEQQSALSALAAGQTLKYGLTWRLASLPKGLESRPGNDALVAFARQLAKLP